MDHPTGTADGRHLHPGFRVPMCSSCHRLRSYVDQRVGIEGGSLEGRPWLVSRRIGAWFGILAMARRPITFGPELLAWLAQVLSDWGDL